MTYSEKAALERLSQIKDPVSDRDLIAAGRLADMAHKDGVIRAVLQVDPKLAAQYESVRAAAEAALAELEGIHAAQVILTAHQAAPDVKSSSKSRTNPHAKGRQPGYQGDAMVDHVVAVSSAKGGVGKSTLAVNLAASLVKSGKRVGILDADIHGPSLPLLLGLRGERAKTREVSGRPLIAPLEAHGLKAMSIGFLTDPDGSIVWRGPMVHGAMTRMLWDVDWGDLDILIIDMPPGTGDAQLGLAQDIKPRGAVIVSTPQDLALEDARKGVDMFSKVDIPVLGLIENMSQFVCPECGSQHAIFGHGGAEAEAKAADILFLGAAPLTLPIRKSGDSGVPIALGEGPESEIFSQMADKLWRLLNEPTV
ncbi:MAG: Mrp/NBP35 family ATP-binding protein [Maricaulaceae bacterium]